MPRNRALIYIRKSVVRTGSDTISPERQRQRCLEEAEHHGWIVEPGDIYTDAEGHMSGRTDNRPDWLRLRHRLHRDDTIAAVIVESLSRTSQERIAGALADAGADLIVGHHPHAVQGVQYHAEAFTAYSLGNYVFDIDMTAESLQGAMLRCLLDPTGVKTVEFVPVSIDDCRPVLMDPADAEAVLGRMDRVTRERRAVPAPR